jgi:VanZ family protein
VPDEGTVKARRFWWLALAWASIIFLLSSIPGKSMPDVPGLQYDKLLHALVYSVLGGLIFLALRQGTSLPTKRVVAVAAGFALLYGLTDEFHQLFVAGRSADLYDALADGIGGIVGASIVSRLPIARPGAAG